jgi:hypothetical protein
MSMITVFRHSLAKPQVFSKYFSILVVLASPLLSPENLMFNFALNLCPKFY